MPLEPFIMKGIGSLRRPLRASSRNLRDLMRPLNTSISHLRLEGLIKAIYKAMPFQALRITSSALSRSLSVLLSLLRAS